MKKTQVCSLLALLVLGSAAVVQAQPAGAVTEKAIVALEEQWLKSQQTNNADLVAPLLEISTPNASVEFSTPDDPNNFTQSPQLLAVASSSGIPRYWKHRRGARCECLIRRPAALAGRTASKPRLSREM